MKKAEFKQKNIKVSYPGSCYVTIGDTVFYIEISKATENKPFIRSWKESDYTDNAEEYVSIRKEK